MRTEKQIFLLDDDRMIGMALKSDLTRQGYGVTWTTTLSEARKAWSAGGFHLALIDLNLPDGHAFPLCREMRDAAPNLPILILTASTDEESAVRGLSLGASDYLRKPFGRQELLLRIKRFLDKDPLSFKIGSLVVEESQRAVSYQGNKLDFTPTEFDILLVLLAHREEAVTRASVLEKIDEEGNTFDRTLNSHVSRLRSKLKKAGVTEIEIASVYGTGYRLEVKG